MWDISEEGRRDMVAVLAFQYELHVASSDKSPLYKARESKPPAAKGRAGPHTPIRRRGTYAHARVDAAAHRLIAPLPGRTPAMN